MSDNSQTLLYTFEKLLIENAKNNIYLEMVSEISENDENNESNLDVETTSKIHNVLMYHNLNNCTLLQQDDCVNTFNILDLKENNSQLFTYKDTNYIKECLKKKVKDKHTNVFKEVNKFTKNNLIDVSLLMTTSFPKLMKIEPILLEQVTEIYKEQNEYGLLLKKLGKLLEDLLNIRLNQFVTTCSTKSQNLEMNIKLLKFKMLYSMLALKKSIFLDTKDTLSAYKIIIAGLNEKKDELIATIQERENILNILTNMSNDPEMLRLYNQYCDLRKAIELKKYFYSD